MLDEEAHRLSVCHAQPTHSTCETRQNHSIDACAHALGFRPQDLVAVVSAPPQVGSVTPRALEVGVSKKHPTTLVLFSVLPKILSKKLSFLR